MNNLNKLIRLKVLEIGMTLGFVAFSFFLWDSFRNGEVIEAMNSVDNNRSYAYVDIVKESKYLLAPMKDEEALESLVPKTISMQNGTHLNTDYAFGLKIDKASTLDYQNIKIAFNHEVSYLKDFYEKEDNDYYYFVFDKGSLSDANQKTYEIQLWLDENTTLNYSNKNLLYEFTNLADVL